MNTSLVFAGLPHTGKSTYLALLNLALTRRDRVSLTLGSYKDDREYLNDLSQNLFLCEQPSRTHVDQRRGLSISLIAGDRDLWLEIPDLSGELWQELVRDRTWTAELQDNTREATGICVFVHAGEFRQDPTLAEVDEALARLGVDDVEDDHNQYGSGEPFGQTALVDLLQIVGEQFRTSSTRRVSLVLSAFDAAGTAKPRDWVRDCAPLLRQYLAYNADRANVRVFGLSAQGGDFSEDDELARLKKLDPLARAYLVSDEGVQIDLDEPIRWALGLD